MTVFLDERGFAQGRFRPSEPCSPIDARAPVDLTNYLEFCSLVKAVRPRGYIPQWIWNELSVDLAGAAFAVAYDRDLAFRISATDIKQASILAQACSDPEMSVNELLSQALRRAAEVCDHNRGAILGLANI